MKIKTVIIFPNGSLSFYDKNLSLSNTKLIQHIFIKAVLRRIMILKVILEAAMNMAAYLYLKTRIKTYPFFYHKQLAVYVLMLM